MTSSRDTQPIRVIIVDDHPIILEGIQELLRHKHTIKVVGATASGIEALDLVETLRPNVLLLDLRLPDMHGLEVARRVRAACPEVAILVLTGYEDAAHARALVQIGVRGYIRKSTPGPQIVAAVQAVASGRIVIEDHIHLLSYQNGASSFTNREFDVLRLIVAGHRNSEIAETLNVSIKTVEFHVGHILSKMQARSRAEAIRFAIQKGIVSLDDHNAEASSGYA